ncbi:MAG TPA: TIM-barrel domain-containing protein [Levilinea sp.]|nr:TIM-barrel domain-containing protein [Levilinea sp.]
MYTVKQSFHPPFAPAAQDGAVVRAPKVRFTVLSPRLIRMEYSPSEHFEDRPSQAFWYRNQPVPDYTRRKDGDRLEIDTGELRLTYQLSAGQFNPHSLAIEVRSVGQVYFYGDAGAGNLMGTYRTLDGLDGKVNLETGLVSRDGWAVYDDSQSLVFDAGGWLQPRQAEEDALDLYFFGYGHDYLACIQDFQKIAGQTPLLPRWALGNWWSRYYPYSETGLKNLMLAFQRHQIPLSVCIIDMDWHITATGNESSGWTGYTWNTDLFPDPPAFIAWLHQQGLKTALNLHPALGVWPHEADYARVARHMGIDPASQQPVEFDVANPRFMQAYFEYLHYPKEEEGVDFWWMDWQQGEQSKVQGLDPLYWLNHLHFYDQAKDDKKRPFIFSRWGGLGNHRYPIGFSGDTIITWDSLGFQPYFTATASNVAYGWWSHDIGGHFMGMEDGELFTRWTQFGVFSPILRMHATRDPYIDHCPWAYDQNTLHASRAALRLRHAFVPYIYTMSWRNEQQGIPLVLPMYYEHPAVDDAYECVQQYYFGSELLAAPVTLPADPEVGLAKQVVWLPEGDWIDFFTGEHYAGGAWRSLYLGREEIPVFARPGAIVPLASGDAVDGIQNPVELEVYIFPGASRRFELFEDDGESNAYRQGAYRITPFRQEWNENRLRFQVEPVQGFVNAGPNPRTFTLLFRGIVSPEQVEAQVDGQPLEIEPDYDPKTSTLQISGIHLAAASRLSVQLIAGGDTLIDRRSRMLQHMRKLLWAARMPTYIKQRIEAALPDMQRDICAIEQFAAVMTPAQLRAFIEQITGAGVIRLSGSGDKDRIILWNPNRCSGFRYALGITTGWWGQGEDLERGPVPPSLVIAPQERCGVHEDMSWRLQVDYFGITSQAYGHKKEIHPPSY